MSRCCFLLALLAGRLEYGFQLSLRGVQNDGVAYAFHELYADGDASSSKDSLHAELLGNFWKEKHIECLYLPAASVHDKILHFAYLPALFSYDMTPKQLSSIQRTSTFNGIVPHFTFSKEN
jgi:hypothetical protein